jgi:hypothetical protein
MFRSATDHHQGAYLFLVKISYLKYEYSYVMLPHHHIATYELYIKQLRKNIKPGIYKEKYQQ